MGTGKIFQIRLKRWEDIHRLPQFLRADFIYRGQNNADWKLKTAIERLTEIGTNIPNYTVIETDMIIEFHKRHSLYSKIKIDCSDTSDLLAMMQHYGTATRLLDFTYSLFIAAYFAVVENASSNADSAAIWAVNRKRLEDNHEKSIKADYNSYANKTILEAQLIGAMDNFEKTVIPFEPLNYTERLSKQQGVFLMPTGSAYTFEDNLCSAFKVDSFSTVDVEFQAFYEMLANNKEVCIFKIVIPKKIYCDVAESLIEMNINAEVLFPGLDGLAKSINNRSEAYLKFWLLK